MTSWFASVALVASLMIPGVSSGAQKRVVLNSAYDHDRWGTVHADITRNYRAYTTSFDSDDDDDGDGYVDTWGIPEFVAYEIKRFNGTLKKGPPRPGWFTDPELARQGIAPRDATYRYSKAFRSAHPNWYVRGHLCMKQHAWRLGRNADWNTHTMLNAVPQRQLFNGGIWLDLEDKTAEWADKYGSVWIIAGPVIEGMTPRNWLGEERRGEMLIAIPDALFKIVVREGSNDSVGPEVLAFIYPQDHPDYGEAPYHHKKFLRKVDEIERLTGLDFLTDLPDEVERRIERRKARELWE